MSFGVHRIWKHLFMQRLNPPHGTELLDVAGGSGKYFMFLIFDSRRCSIERILINSRKIVSLFTQLHFKLFIRLTNPIVPPIFSLFNKFENNTYV